MECFTGFWSQHLAQTSGSPIQPTWIGATSKNKFKTSIIKSKSFQDIILQSSDMIMASEHCSSSDDLREELKNKAEKHRKYYRSLLESSISTNTSTSTSISASISYKNENKVALDVLTDTLRENTNPDEVELEFEYNKQEYVMEKDKIKRVRRTGVFQIGNVQPEGDDYTFQGVKKLRENYLNLLENSSTKKQEDTQQKSEYDLLQPPAPPSGYCSSTASATSDDEREKEKWSKNNVKRCGSSDSAVGNSDGDEEAIHSNWGETQEIIDDILPYPLIKSPYSPRGSIDHTNVPSKTIIEAKFVPLPVDRKLSDCVSEIECDLGNDSRRPSVFTDDGDEVPRYRYWRTPSVVISDYSDDIMGLTLEDIEFIRNNIAAENNSSADSSLHSSCSNLYCGSTISSLDSEYVLKKPYRKSSDCSTCSTPSDDESEGKHIREPSGWRKLRNIVQWTPFFQTYKKQRYPWIQLAGHQGNFKAGPDQGTILKKLCVKEEKCFKVLMGDSLKPYVPEYKGLVASDDGECSYIQLQDLLGDFVSPCVMDCKIGVRTYLEEELAKAKEKPKLRKDMYEKMCQIDSQAPTDEEHRLKGVTKPRYMVWRETISSTATLGFRIEGIRKADGTSSKDFKTTRSKDDVMNAFIDFTEGFPHAVPKYIQRLKAIKSTLESSQFFNTHEVIGSSLLFVHDRHNANVWLIDFAKTILLPDDVKISHNSKWKVGNHEDGYMIGVNNLISIFKTMLELQPITISPPLALQDPPEMNENILEHTT